ncbi:MAG: hypothetical protein K0R22_2515 [Sporomusa sp.]|nr:hypothetical protein [Sporomusa sp.]
MPNNKHPYWEEPDIEEWDDDEDEWEDEAKIRNDRQLLPFILGLGLGFGFGCFPRRNCYPRDYGCRPRRHCYPRQGCYPWRRCYPRPCYPI